MSDATIKTVSAIIETLENIDVFLHLCTFKTPILYTNETQYLNILNN